MKADVDTSRTDVGVSASTRYIGRFVRKTGTYGTVAVVGKLAPGGVEIIGDPKRLFQADGNVESRGVQHAQLKPDDWVAFDVSKNVRPRAPAWKADHLTPIPRYAVLPEGSLSSYRVLLTAEGWSGDVRPGLWALRISGDRVIVTDLVAGKDGLLRIPPDKARTVRFVPYQDEDAVSLPIGSRSELAYIGDNGQPGGNLDWSDEADHVARVIRALADIDDPQVSAIITWLDLHREAGTGRISAATLNHGAAEAAIRSGELAERLRADLGLMRAYLDAAVSNPEVREAIARHAREGESAERERIRAELEQELTSERDRRMAAMAEDIEAARTEADAGLEEELARTADRIRQARERLEAEAAAAHAARVADMIAEFDGRRSDLEEEVARIAVEIEARKTGCSERGAELDSIEMAIGEAKGRLQTANAELDRLLLISDRVSSTISVEAPASTSGATVSPSSGPKVTFSELPRSPMAEKAARIDAQVLLSEKGRDLMRKLISLMLAGEMPIVFGQDALDFLAVAGAMICPGRIVGMEADPTLISIEDVWARPGSGTPTMMARAAEASEKGVVLAVVRGIERSGARFWVPALRDYLRGDRPRGLLVCCTISNTEHDELAALSDAGFVIEAEGIFSEVASFGAPQYLFSAKLDRTALDPGPMPDDLSQARLVLAEFDEMPSVGHAIRIARLFAEAENLLGDAEKAKVMTVDLVRSMAGRDA